MLLEVFVSFFLTDSMQHIQSFELMILQQHRHSFLQEFYSSLEVDHVHDFFESLTEGVSFFIQFPVRLAVYFDSEVVEGLPDVSEEAETFGLFAVKIDTGNKNFHKDLSIRIHEEEQEK